MTTSLEIERAPARRILAARMELSAIRGEKISQEAFGALLALEMLRERPITGATVSRWETGENVPDLATLEGIASLCEIDPGWLAFGCASVARKRR